MLRDPFIGRKPSHFTINRLVKSFIISETFLWSARNFIVPIFAIFAANKIENGGIAVAGTAFSIFLITRIMVELASGKAMQGRSENQTLLWSVYGLVILSLSYLGLAFTTNILFLYIFFSLGGMGLGVATPAKNALFSRHLDHNEESIEWGIYDAAVFMGMAMSAALGGFIAEDYGFRVLFILTAIINTLAIVPYLLYLKTPLNPDK